MALPHIETGGQDLKMQMVIMTSARIYDVIQAELLFVSNCSII